MPSLAQVIVGVVCAIFGAGVAWGALRGEVQRLRKDLNAIGANLRRLESALMVTTEKREDRERLCAAIDRTR